MKKTILKVLFGAMSAGMIALVIFTSFKSNLLEALPELNAQPWFVTTIVDFYFNIAIISVWVIYKEKKLISALTWIISFILLGSITTSAYVLIQLMKLKDSDTLENALLRNV